MEDLQKDAEITYPENTLPTDTDITVPDNTIPEREANFFEKIGLFFSLVFQIGYRLIRMWIGK